MSLNPYTPERFTDSILFLKEIDGQKLLVKTFINQHKESRRELELQKNQRWNAAGFCVPRIMDIEFKEITEPYVVMEYIDGINLSDYLKNPEIPLTAKLKTLSEIFKINYRRHMLAREQNDALLIHTDPNTDNIIISPKGLVFIDFEHLSKTLDISNAIAKEVGRFIRRAIKDLGTNYMREAIEILLTAYNYDASIFNSVEELALDRPFQSLRRFKNKLKKLKNSKLVTHQDIAEAIKLLRASPINS